MVDSALFYTADIGYELTSGYISSKGLRILIIFVWRESCLSNFSYGKSKFLSITSYGRHNGWNFKTIDLYLFVTTAWKNTGRCRVSLSCIIAKVLLNWSLQPFCEDYNLASHVIHIVCVNILHEWRGLQFNVNSEWQIFEKLFTAIFFYF